MYLQCKVWLLRNEYAYAQKQKGKLCDVKPAGLIWSSLHTSEALRTLTLTRIIDFALTGNI